MNALQYVYFLVQGLCLSAEAWLAESLAPEQWVSYVLDNPETTPQQFHEAWLGTLAEIEAPPIELSGYDKPYNKLTAKQKTNISLFIKAVLLGQTLSDRTAPLAEGQFFRPYAAVGDTGTAQIHEIPNWGVLLRVSDPTCSGCAEVVSLPGTTINNNGLLARSNRA